MSKLTRLAKLRQFSKDQDVKEWLMTEHRQNMLAIESSLNTSLLNSSTILETLPFGIGVNSNEFIPFDSSTIIDPLGIYSDGIFSVSSDSKFEISLTFKGISLGGPIQMLLRIYTGSEYETHNMFITNSLSLYTIGYSTSFIKSISAGSKLRFSVESTASPGGVNVLSGLIKFNKLNI